jgi:uncharacterized membrane protein
MEAGSTASSPIVQALAKAEAGTTGEIRVHLTKSLFEKDPFGRATRLFERFGMARTSQHNAVLLYVNLRKQRFAIAADHGIDQAVGPHYWKLLSKELAENLRSTHPERAIALAIESLGQKLRQHFPENL